MSVTRETRKILLDIKDGVAMLIINAPEPISSKHSARAA